METGEVVIGSLNLQVWVLLCQQQYGSNYWTTQNIQISKTSKKSNYDPDENRELLATNNWEDMYIV